jgi:hypothetical protein
MQTKRFLFLWLLYSLWTAQAAPAKPNIVFILADDLGYLSLDVHANHHNKKGTK